MIELPLEEGLRSPTTVSQKIPREQKYVALYFFVFVFEKLSTNGGYIQDYWYNMKSCRMTQSWNGLLWAFAFHGEQILPHDLPYLSVPMALRLKRRGCRTETHTESVY